jgi:DNA-binding transcriptional regulator YiaG
VSLDFDQSPMEDDLSAALFTEQQDHGRLNVPCIARLPSKPVEQFKSHTMPFSARLRATRLAANLSQASAAALTGYCERTIRNWESGKREPHAVLQTALIEKINQKTNDTRRNETGRIGDGRERYEKHSTAVSTRKKRRWMG